MNSRKNGDNPASRNSALMRAMGSKTGRFDPEPPDQWLYQLNHGRGPDQALAWIKSKTIALGHESAYCTGERGRALKIADMAAELGWEIQTAKNVLGLLKSEGRARTDEDGRIYLCADVPLAHVRDEPEPDAKPAAPDDFEYFVQSTFSGYLADSVRGLSAEMRPVFMQRYRAYEQYRDDVLKEAVAAARAITDQYETNIFQDVGIEKRRLKAETPRELEYIQLSLKAEPYFVQSTNGNGSVQSAEAGLYKPENGSVQTISAGASLFTSDNRHSDKKKGAAAADAALSVDQEGGAPEQGPPPPPAPAHEERPQSNPWEEVHRAIQSKDVTADAEEIWALIDTCRHARIGLPPAFLLDVIERWPINGAHSPFRIFVKQLPGFLRDAARVDTWIKQGPSPSPGNTGARMTSEEKFEQAAEMRRRRKAASGESR